MLRDISSAGKRGFVLDLWWTVSKQAAAGTKRTPPIRIYETEFSESLNANKWNNRSVRNPDDIPLLHTHLERVQNNGQTPCLSELLGIEMSRRVKWKFECIGEGSSSYLKTNRF